MTCARATCWILIALAAAPAVGCAVQIQRDTVINAPAAAVWEIATDTKRYPQWNPYHVYVAGELVEGEALIVDIEKPNGATITVEPIVERVVPGLELVWSWGTWGWVTHRHTLRVVDVGEGKTRFVQSERVTGIGALFADMRAVGPGYKLATLAAKSRAEARRREAP